MIGLIPRSLKVGEENIPIRADFRICLNILQAWTDIELNDIDKMIITLQLLYKEPILPGHYIEAYEQAKWFLDGGGVPNEPKPHTYQARLYDWEQDESIIFSAINKVAGREVRECEFLHWWTFLGYFNEIGEGTFSSVMNIRYKKATGKKLEKWEQDFYKKHKDMIDIKKARTAKEQEELDEVNVLLGI